MINSKNYQYYLTPGRQPVVTMIEAALGRCSDDWKAQNTEINTKLDMMLELQKQRLELDRARLEFERQMAGLPAAKVNAKGRSTHKRRKGT